MSLRVLENPESKLHVPTIHHIDGPFICVRLIMFDSLLGLFPTRVGRPKGADKGNTSTSFPDSWKKIGAVTCQGNVDFKNSFGALAFSG